MQQITIKDEQIRKLQDALEREQETSKRLLQAAEKPAEPAEIEKAVTKWKRIPVLTSLFGWHAQGK